MCRMTSPACTATNAPSTKKMRARDTPPHQVDGNCARELLRGSAKSAAPTAPARHSSAELSLTCPNGADRSVAT